MTRPLTLLAALAVAVAPASALAAKSHTKHHAKATVLRAKLVPTTPEIKAYTAYAGKAQMVANKRNAKISIHLTNMVAGATYPWAVVTGSCDGPAVTGLKYKTLKARKSGVANAKGSAKKKGFTFDKTATYFVVVRPPGATAGALLCGRLKAKAKKPHTAHAKHQTSKTKGKGGH
jgi:hypothetical protein